MIQLGGIIPHLSEIYSHPRNGPNDKGERQIILNETI